MKRITIFGLVISLCLSVGVYPDTTLDVRSFKQKLESFLSDLGDLYVLSIEPRGTYETTEQYEKRKEHAQNTRNAKLQLFYEENTAPITVTIPVETVGYNADKERASATIDFGAIPTKGGYPQGGGSGRSLPRFLCYVPMGRDLDSRIPGGNIGRLWFWFSTEVPRGKAKVLDIVNKKGAIEITFTLGYRRYRYSQGWTRYDISYFPTLTIVRFSWNLLGQELGYWEGTGELFRKSPYPAALW